ncbi:hypothetical protein [Entomomonas asaccharolytica]|uniref:Uncharacterized protein n=1 Tax=Entomomonas asaccharolytica TaxID=2785331 RepID=A0A974NGT8_9GAMM|nr:hypothetical protein [Entomomonas asaccharolytica]QQP86320.1 hypothetical protein JHT90_03500 [Entomomonas asaccharolytica]
MHFDENVIRKWAYSTDLDKAVDQFIENDQSGDLFDYEIDRVCTIELVWEFAKDPNCLKQHFFLHRLIDRLCSIYRLPFHTLKPFKSSHLLGIENKQDYLAKVANYAENLYRHNIILNEMLNNDDTVIKYIRNQIYNFIWINPEDSTLLGNEKQNQQPSIQSQYEKAYYSNIQALHKAVSELTDK